LLGKVRVEARLLEGLLCPHLALPMGKNIDFANASSAEGVSGLSGDA
jgi:hypothetical protein